MAEQLVSLLLSRMIDQQTINQIFDTADIVEVISDFVTLKKSGANYKGLSPFSNEKTPSFMVSPSKGIFKDFSSGKGGNVVGFLMEHEKLSYPEALRYLAQRYNIAIEEKELTADEIQQRNERESLMAVTAFATSYFVSQLESDEGKAIGLTYFRNRGFRDDILKKFELGYSPEKWTAFTEEAGKNGYKKSYLLKTGLSIERDNNTMFDRFAERVIFPIHSLSGNVIGFGGRTLKSDKKTAKYLNSPESDIYHKSRVLYGLFQAKKTIVSDERCFLVEGYTDVISLHQAGIENVVASSGTALTTEQIRLIKRFTQNVTILYDGDEAGIRASFRGIDMILEEGMNVKVVMLPQGEDPDSYAQSHSSSEFLEYIKTSEKDFISFKTEILLVEAQHDPIKRAQLITDIVKSVSVIPDGIMRSVFLKESSLLLGVEEQVLYNEVNKIRRRKQEQQWRREQSGRQVRQEAPTTMPRQPVVPGFVENIYSEVEEREIIYFLLKFANLKLHFSGEEQTEISVAQYIIREIQNDELEFTNLVYNQIFEDVKDLIERGDEVAERYFVYHDHAGVRELAVDIFTSRYELSKVWKRKEAYVELPGENLGFEVPKSLLSYKMMVIEKALSLLRKELEESEKKQDIEALNQVIVRIQSLEKVRRELSIGLGGRAIIR